MHVVGFKFKLHICCNWLKLIQLPGGGGVSEKPNVFVLSLRPCQDQFACGPQRATVDGVGVKISQLVRVRALPVGSLK